MDVVVKLEVVKDMPLKTPRFATPGPVTQHLDRHGYSAFTGIGPDLMTAARDAVSYTIDALCREHIASYRRHLTATVGEEFLYIRDAQAISLDDG